MDFKWISETLIVFGSKQRVFVLIILLLFISGTYIVTSSFKKSDCSDYQSELTLIHKDVERIQSNEAKLIKTNQELYTLLDSIQNILIQKKRQELQSLKNNTIEKLNARVAIDSLNYNEWCGTSEIMKIKDENDNKIKDIQYIDNILKIINKNKKAK